MTSHLLLKRIMLNDQDAMRWLSKIVAMNIRNRLEDFHIKNIPDSLMPELNHEIRGGVYDVLVALANYDADEFSSKVIGYLNSMLPDYWEEPELQKDFEKALLPTNEVVFKSAFLNEEFKSGNLYLFPNTPHVRTKASYDFTGVDENEGKKHLNKISSQLRKEGYAFDHCIECYVKQK